MDRDQWASWAEQAARDPSTAQRIARELARELRQALAEGDGDPPGYVYAGAHQWILSAQDVEPEPVPDPSNPDRFPVTTTSNPEVTIVVPFNALIMGVAGWCTITPPVPDEGSYSEQDLRIVNLLSCAEDGRDLFSTIIMVDGRQMLGTDGDTDLMFPASCVVGTRTRPRPLAWRVQTNQKLQCKFRNLTNLVLSPSVTNDLGLPVLRKVALAFYALNLDGPL